jgi:hypothetical protein
LPWAEHRSGRDLDLGKAAPAQPVTLQALPKIGIEVVHRIEEIERALERLVGRLPIQQLVSRPRRRPQLLVDIIHALVLPEQLGIGLEHDDPRRRIGRRSRSAGTEQCRKQVTQNLGHRRPLYQRLVNAIGTGGAHPPHRYAVQNKR